MHPLSLFPQLLTFGLIAPTILRITVGVFLISLGLKRYNKKFRWAFIAYFLSGALVFIGLYTQLASVIGMVSVGFDYYLENKTARMTKDEVMIYIFAGVILLSLLFTGPGFFAFDLPL